MRPVGVTAVVANSWAVALPMPDEVPVMRTLLPHEKGTSLAGP